MPAIPDNKPAKILYQEIFPLEEIQTLQDLFATATGVASIITTPEGVPITRPSNFRRLCEHIVRKTEKGLCNCYLSDKILGAYHPSGPLVNHCYSAGLWDAGASITAGNQHIANWLIGQVRDTDPDPEKIAAYALEIGADQEAFLKAYMEVPVMSESQFRKIADMLFVFANHLSESTFKNVKLNEMIRELAIEQARSFEREELLLETGRIARIGGWELDLESNKLSWSEMTRRIHEVPEDYEPSLEKGIQFYAPEAIPVLKKAIEESIEKGSPFDLELEFDTFKGNRLWVHSIGKAKTSEGRVIKLTGTFQDITHRKKTEIALKQNEFKFRTLFDTMSQGVVFQDKTGKITSANPAASRILGLSSEALLGRDSDDKRWQAIKPDGSPFPGEEHPSMLALKTGKPVLNVEMGLIKPEDKSHIWILINAFPQFLNGDKEPFQVFTTFEDITGRKQTLDKLRESEERHRSILMASPDDITISDLEGNILMVSPAALRMYGVTSETEMIGRNVLEYILPEDHQRARSNLTLLMQGIRTGPAVYSGLRQDGSVLPIEVNAEFIPDAAGNPTQIVYVVRDVSERMKTEEKLRDSNTTKDKLLSIIAHDLRNPFNSIMGLSEILSDPYQTFTEEEVKEIAASLHKTSVSAFNLLENLLEWSRLQRGMLKPEKSFFLVRHIVERSLGSLTDMAQNKQIRVILSVPAALMIYADERMIETILRNLISNAVKFSPPGAEVWVSAEKAKDGTVSISIRDQGIGIPSDTIPLLFNIDESKSRPGTHGEKSSGLGLVLCWELAQLNHARITVQSDPGIGSVFAIILSSTDL